MMAISATNEYLEMIPIKVYAKIPKRIFATMLISEYFNRDQMSGHEMVERMKEEWEILHRAGIVPEECRLNAEDVDQSTQQQEVSQ